MRQASYGTLRCLAFMLPLIVTHEILFLNSVSTQRSVWLQTHWSKHIKGSKERYLLRQNTTCTFSGITPQIRVICFVLINSVLLNRLLFPSCFRTLAVILVSDFFFFFFFFFHSHWLKQDVCRVLSSMSGLLWQAWQTRSWSEDCASDSMYRCVETIAHATVSPSTGRTSGC